jgi:heme a synthase
MRAAHRLALLTGGATLLLILAGGLVTNTGSALAVPDWPTTFGHNMFFYPWSQMVGGVFYEHSHRLLGSLVGLLTLGLAATLWRAGGGLRVAGMVAAIAVVAQGVLGGLRVVLLQDALAILHGCLAQAFFALVAALALATSPRGQLPVASIDPGVRTATLLAAALVYLQIVFGALLTHAGWLEVHLVGALAVFALVPVAAARLIRSGDAVAAPLARSLLALLALQLVLGVATLVARLAPEVLPGPALLLALPVAHRLAGSLILAASVMLALRVWSSARLARPFAGAVETTA